MTHMLSRTLLPALALLTGVSACGQIDQSPSAPALSAVAALDRVGVANPADPRIAAQKPASTASLGSFALARCVNRVPATYSATFGPAGGVLEFGDSRLIIPGGALSEKVTISATVVDATTSRVELQPHGLQFAKPAGLQLGTTDCVLSNPDYPNIVYLGADGTVLETIAAVYDPHWHTVASPIDHFSGYAMGF